MWHTVTQDQGAHSGEFREIYSPRQVVRIESCDARPAEVNGRERNSGAIRLGSEAERLRCMKFLLD